MTCCDDCEHPRYTYPEYRYTELIEREALRHITPLALPAGEEIPISTLSSVRRQAIFTVRYGEAHVWFLPDASRAYVGGDEPHLILTPAPEPFVLDLAPGRHQFVVGAGGSLDLTACVIVQDVEARG